MQANVTAGQMAGMQLNSPGQLCPHQASQQACVFHPASPAMC